MKYLCIVLLALFIESPVAFGSPFMSLELKPMSVVKPTHKDSKEFSLATEFHLTSKISVFASYLQSKFEEKNSAQSVGGYYFENPSAVQSYKISETGLGAMLYSEPLGSSIYLGMGVIQKQAAYRLYLSQMPIEWNTTANDPIALFGYRWSLGNALMIRTGLNARWTRTYNDKLSGSSAGYYLSRDSEQFVQETVSDIEGKQELKTALDIGFGVIF